MIKTVLLVWLRTSASPRYSAQFLSVGSLWSNELLPRTLHFRTYYFCNNHYHRSIVTEIMIIPLKNVMSCRGRATIEQNLSQIRVPAFRLNKALYSKSHWVPDIGLNKTPYIPWVPYVSMIKAPLCISCTGFHMLIWTKPTRWQQKLWHFSTVSGPQMNFSKANYRSIGYSFIAEKAHSTKILRVEQADHSMRGFIIVYQCQSTGHPSRTT